ncbi:sce7726 family protein [Trebonia sp.]|uniref:sce7726 family protein n=1 Tax=Trebonia sp. TaxID=2767075 RepID=UPI002610C6CB|nr:sce7726 family protein [Trebonia sp.]
MLRRQHRGCRTVYRREWSIGVGATRVDVAAINGRIIGCEVKSARDNFGRLPSQVELYSAILDTALLAVEGLAAAERARDLLPSWWGIWLARPTLRGAVFEVIQEPGSNPAPKPLSIAQLLWRDEAYSVLDRRGLSGGLRKATRWRLWEALAGQLPLHELQDEVRNAIKARPEW